MKSINNYLFEKFTVNSETKNEDMPKVYSSKSGKELNIKWYCDNKADWQKFEGTYLQLEKHFLLKYSKMYLCKYEDDKWVAQVGKCYSINDYQPNYRYFYSSNKNYYTFKQLMEMLDSTQYMVILTDKK